MMLTDLDQAFRSAGIPHLEESGWRTRGRGQMTAVKTITIHHTAGGSDAGDRRVVRDGRPDLPGPLAHILLETSGTPRIIAAGMAAHAGESRDASFRNPFAVGIEAVHDGISPWPAHKYAGLVAAAGALARHYGLPTSRILGHKETCAPAGRKIDPSFSMVLFRADVHAWLTAHTPTPKPTPTPPTEGVLMALTDQQQADLYARIMGGIPSGSAEGRTSTKGVPARILDSEDGDYLRVLLLGIADKVGIDIAGVRATLDVHAGAVKDAADALREVADRLTGDDRARIDGIVARLRITLDPTP